MELRTANPSQDGRWHKRSEREYSEKELGTPDLCETFDRQTPDMF